MDLPTIDAGGLRDAGATNGEAEAASPQAPASPLPTARVNGGRFQPGDARINRAGRPKGSKKAAVDADPDDLAPATDRLMRLLVPVERMGLDWMPGVAAGAAPVGAHFDQRRGGIVLTLRSPKFGRVAGGTPIPLLPADDGRPPLAQATGRFARLVLPRGYQVVGVAVDETGQLAAVISGEGLRQAAAGQSLPRVRVELSW
jgi:hypothetical protein